jgi:hypothetical protein
VVEGKARDDGDAHQALGAMFAEAAARSRRVRNVKFAFGSVKRKILDLDTHTSAASMSTKRARADSAGAPKRASGRSPTMLKELAAAITCDGNPQSLSTLLAPILRACEAFDAEGNADGTVLCVCEAYFVVRSIALQSVAMVSAAISGAAPSKLVAKALK